MTSELGEAVDMLRDDRDALLEALKLCVSAMKRAQREGYADHFDDGGAFWYEALTAAAEAGVK
jgi:hypothetical protein